MRFALDITAAPEDVDELGHVSNVVYVRWIQDVAMGHSIAAGWDHAAYRRLGAVFVVRKHEIEYLAPCVAGDAVRLTTWVASLDAASSVRRTTITRAADAVSEAAGAHLPRRALDPRATVELCRASTLWVFVGYDNGRPRRIPAEIRSAFAVVSPMST